MGGREEGREGGREGERETAAFNLEAVILPDLCWNQILEFDCFLVLFSTNSAWLEQIERSS